MENTFPERGNVLMFCHHQNSFLVVQGAHASSSCDPPRPRAFSEPPFEGRAETLHDVYAASLALRAEGRDFRKSLGSVGHPEFCRRACVYQKFQSCSHGARCQFCHEPHQNDVKFQKRQRNSLREMSEQNLLTFLLPHLEARALHAPGSSFIMSLIRGQMASLPPPDRRLPPQWRLNEISEILCRLSFRRLVELCPCSREPIFQKAMAMVRLCQVEDT